MSGEQTVAINQRFTLRAVSVALLLAVVWLSPCGSMERPATLALRRPSTGIVAVPESGRYKIDASQSRFIVRAFAGGFLSALAHHHTIAIRHVPAGAAVHSVKSE